MPDGGNDCCGNCVFNSRWGTYHDPALEGLREPRADCVLRGIQTPDPFWTYCDWFHGGEFYYDALDIIATRPEPYRLDAGSVQELVRRSLAFLSDSGQPFTPVWANGLGTRRSYTRIPWDGPNRPHIWLHAVHCHMCGADDERSGIRIEPRDLPEALTFCSDECYTDWWETRHPPSEHWPWLRGVKPRDSGKTRLPWDI